MADRNFQQFQYSLEKKVVNLFATVTFSSGAATLVRGKGIASITSAGSGVYNVVLQDKYKTMLGCEVSFKDASAVPGPAFMSAYDAAAGTLSVKFTNSSLSAANPADSTTAFIHIILGNSSAL